MSKRRRVLETSEPPNTVNDGSNSGSPASFEPVSDSKMDTFLAWCKLNGAYGLNTLKQVVSSKNGMRTVITKDEIAAGQEFASIPCDMVLDGMVAFQSELGRRVVAYLKDWEEKKEQEMPNRHRVLLLSFLVYERFQRKNNEFDLDKHGKVGLSASAGSPNSPSAWFPYLAVLPESYDDPLHWPADEVTRELAGTNLAHYLVHREADLRSELEHAQKAVGDLFDDGVLDWKNWLWANSAVYSRAFPGKWTPFSSATREDGKTNFELGNPALEPCGLALLPFLDMINHDPLAHVDWFSGTSPSSSVAPNEARVRFAHPSNSPSSLPAGSEIFNNYGAKSNEEFLIGYGFVLANNAADTVRILVNDARDRDPEFARKAKLLSKTGNHDNPEVGLGDKAYGLVDGQHLFHLRRDELAGDLVELMKCLCLDSWELDLVDSGKLDSSAHLEKPQIIVRSFARLYELLKSKRDVIQTTHKKAEKYWKKETKSGRPRTYGAQCASTLRQGQIDILKTAMDNCTANIQRLGEKVKLVDVSQVIQDEAFQALLAAAATSGAEPLELGEDEVMMVYLACKFSGWLQGEVKSSLGVGDGEDLNVEVDAVLGDGSFESLQELYEQIASFFPDSSTEATGDLKAPTLETIALAAVALQRFGVEVDPGLVGAAHDEDGDGEDSVMLVVAINV